MKTILSGRRGPRGNGPQEYGDPDRAPPAGRAGCASSPSRGKADDDRSSVQLSANGRAPSAVHPEGRQVGTAETGWQFRRNRNLAAAGR